MNFSIKFQSGNVKVLVAQFEEVFEKNNLEHFELLEGIPRSFFLYVTSSTAYYVIYTEDLFRLSPRV